MKLAICRYCEQPLLRPKSVCPRCQMRNDSGHSLLWTFVALSAVVVVAAVSGLFLG